MGLNAKDFQVCMWKIFKFSMNTCYICVKKHPFGSCILMFFFLLYMFLPSVFKILIYSSPLIVIAAIVYSLFLSNNRKSIKNVKEKEDEKRNDGISSLNVRFVEDDKNKSSSSHIQTARRRNVEEKSREDYAQTSVEDKNTVFSTSFNDCLVDKSAVEEERPKEIREVKVDSIIDNAECSGEGSQKFPGGGGEIERGSSEDTEDEEEAHEDRHKAVQWTEDDQKNLVDLGISEIERNKRLESLIARRRARKLLSLQVRKTLMHMGNNDPPVQIGSILIPRSNPFIPSQFSPAPGSAPSVLLPMHNPFDLPYDPYEEKPNLTGDSFHQEFMEAHHKDMMFCRHESFSLGAFLPRESKHVPNETLLYHDFATKQRALERPENNRGRNPLDKKAINKLIDHRPSQAGEAMLNHVKQEDQASEQVVDLVDIGPVEDGRSEVQTEQMQVEDFDGGSSSSSSSEENEPIFRANKDAILDTLSASKNIAADREDNGRISNLLYDSGPSVFVETRTDGGFFHTYRGVHHTPNRSIASDMQVEVSESSSPPLTVDGNISSPDEESSIHNGDMDKEITSGSEEMWPVSSHLSGVDENESKSREVNEVSEQDIMEVGFSQITHNSDPILPEKIVEQESTDSRSLSPSRPELPEGIQAHTEILNTQIHDEVRPPGASESFDALSSKNLAFPVLEKAQQSTEMLVAHPSHEGDSGKAEEPSNTPKKSGRELSTIYSVNDRAPVDNDTDNLKTIADIGSEANILIKQENARDLLNMSEEGNLKYTEHNGGKYENPGEDHAILESYKPDEEKDNPKSLGSFDEEVEKLVQQEDIAEKLKLIENNTNQESIQDRVYEQGFAELRFSGVGQSLNDPVACTMLPELVVEQILTASSSSSSPKFVLQNKVTMDQASSSTLDQERHIEVQHSSEMVQNNSLDKHPPEKLTPTMSQNALPLAWDSTAQPSNEGKFQELSNPPGKSIMETSSICNVNDSEVPMNNDMENLNAIKNLGNEADILINKENTRDLSKPSEGNSSKSTDDDSGPHFDKLVKNQIILESYKTAEENNNSKPLKYYYGELENLPKHKDMAETSKAVDNNDTWESIQNRVDEQDIPEVEVSGVRQSSHDPITLATVPELQVEEVFTTSTSSSSPKSVLQPKFSMDQASLSNFDQGMNVDVRQSHNEIVEINSVHELPPENLTPAEPQNELRLTEDSTSHPSHNRDFDNLQESFNPLVMSPEEVNIFYESVIHDNKGKEKLKSIEDIEGDSQILSSLETTAELSIPSEEFRSINDTEAMIEKLSEYAPSTGRSAQAEQSDTSITPLAKEEEPYYPHPERSIEEANVICNENESVTGEMDHNDLKSTLRDAEDGSQGLIRPEAAYAAVANSRLVEDVEGRSNKVTEFEATVRSTREVGEDSNLKNIEET